MEDARSAPVGPHTWDEFVNLDEDDLRELIDGELVEVEVPGRKHEKAVAMLVMFLAAWARERKAGEVLASGYKVRISAKRGVMPDVQFFRQTNLPSERHEKGLAEGRPDLAVEITSPSSRRYDRVVKLGYYASVGVAEYWIVDPEAKTLERLVLLGEHYSIVESLAEDATFRPTGFDGLEIPLAELWTA